jgi:hypothetical protein
MFISESISGKEAICDLERTSSAALLDFSAVGKHMWLHYHVSLLIL